MTGKQPSLLPDQHHCGQPPRPPRPVECLTISLPQHQSGNQHQEEKSSPFVSPNTNQATNTEDKSSPFVSPNTNQATNTEDKSSPFVSPNTHFPGSTSHPSHLPALPQLQLGQATIPDAGNLEGSLEAEFGVRRLVGQQMNQVIAGALLLQERRLPAELLAGEAVRTPAASPNCWLGAPARCRG